MKKMVKVKFEKNGLETVLSEEIASIYEKKGKVKILKEVKEPAPKAEK